jgi:hypothetical protein
MSPLIRLVSWLAWLVDRDSMDDAVARVALLRPNVKIVIEKGHTQGGCPGYQTPRSTRLRQDAIMIESSGEQRFVPGSAVRDHLRPEARESIRAFVVVCVYTENRLSQIRTALDSIARQTMPSSRVIVVGDHNPPLCAPRRLVPWDLVGYCRIY